MNFLKKKSGLTALPILLIISGVIVEVVVAFALVANLLGSSELASRRSAEALAAARGGVQDAALRIARDKEFPSGGNTSYNMTIEGVSVGVEVWSDRGEGGSVVSGKHRVVVSASSGIFSRKLEAIFLVDSTGGDVKLEKINNLDI